MHEKKLELCSCRKGRFCICEHIEPQKNKIGVLILQHPQEPKEILGTAIIAQKTLQNSQLVVGLSWPNLKKMVPMGLKPSACACLYLGAHPPGLPQGTVAVMEQQKKEPIQLLIVLDGTWSQAKTLWWRNPWLLKTQRLILNPPAPSLYGSLRKEPRKNCLSTIEAIAWGLDFLGEPAAIKAHLLGNFQRLLTAYSCRASLKED